MQAKPLLIFALAVLLAAGCQMKGSRKDSVGRLPVEVIDLYDAGKPDGWMEIEAGRDGWIESIETDIPVGDVPDNIMDAVRKEMPDGRITGAEFEIIGREPGYELKLSSGGREYELVYSKSGELIEKESEIDAAEAPAAVMAGAGKAVPGGSIKSVERIDRGSSQEYHVKLEKGGASYKVVLMPDGSVERVVREARAEIEIPIQ